MSNGALVVLSGGQDSTICLYAAKRQFDEVHALTFNYGQKHSREVSVATEIARAAGVVSHEVLALGPVLKSTSPLLDANAQVGQYNQASALPGGVEPTFVPARNALFLTLAANRAVALGVWDIFTGVCQADYGGYYDCRQVFIDAMVVALSQAIFGVNGAFKIHTPLMDMTKAQSIEFAWKLPGCKEAMAWTHTCYNGKEIPCGHCHACIIRARGFHEVGVADPLVLRLKRNMLLAADYPDDGLVVAE